MRRINDFDRYRRAQIRAAKRSQKRRILISKRRRTRGHFPHVNIPFVPGLPRGTKLIVPSTFSLVDSPEATIEFFEKIGLAALTGERVILDFRDVKRITVDALLWLLAEMQSDELKRCGVAGNEPNDPEVAKFLLQSGFFSHIAQKPKSYRAEDCGLLKKREGKRVRENVCAELVHYSTEKLYGSRRKNGGLYRALIECMANTRDHASRDRSRTERWWVSANFDQKTGIVNVAFLDTGVGIFKSLRMEDTLKLIGKFLGIRKHHDILRDMLNGELESRTGLSYRGKGFPALKTAQDRKQLHNLRVITNKAYLDSTTGKGRVLNREFKGTCLTWEIHQ